MKKYYDNLDDYRDTSRPPITDWVEWLLSGIFATAGVAMLAYIGFMLMVTAMRL